MKSLLINWSYQENRLANIRKNLCDRGATSSAAIADTWQEQQNNNRRWSNIFKKGQYRRTSSSLV
jgi:hypothetical protein